jgi:hypothetical protein
MAFKRLQGVLEKVDQDLLQANAVAENAQAMRGLANGKRFELPGEPAFQQYQGTIDDVAQLNRFRCRSAFAGECLELLRDRPDPLRQRGERSRNTRALSA